jgi:pimeloyl-ACP methyl ester carboxylesterase
LRTDSATAAADHEVIVGGLRLHARRRRGQLRPPLLLVQGIGGTLDAWAPLLAALPDRDVVMIDSPGSGRSDAPRRPIRMPAIADLIAAALRAQGIERVDLLGFSLGGLVAQELARRHPALVRRLILVATTVGAGGEAGSWRVRRTLLSTKRYRDPARAARDIPVLAGGRTARDPDVLAAILNSRASQPPTVRGYRFQQWAVLGWSSRDWLGRLRVPTLVLHGDDDPTVPPSNARRLAGLIPNAQLQIIPGAGHLLLFDDTAAAARVIDHFLSD